MPILFLNIISVVFFRDYYWHLLVANIITFPIESTYLYINKENRLKLLSEKRIVNSHAVFNFVTFSKTTREPHTLHIQWLFVFCILKDSNYIVIKEI